VAEAEASARGSRSRSDLLIVAAAGALTYLGSIVFEVHERYFSWLERNERWQADELPLSLLVLALGLVWYAFRRRREALAALRMHESSEARVGALLAHNRELAQGLIALQESERLALARELHDEMGQCCAALRVETAFLRHCARDDEAGRVAAASRVDTAAASLYQLVRDLLRRLRPANLDTLGLVAALQELCEAWESRSGVACVFHHRSVDERLADSVQIYRIVQEALTNVVKHAQASTVRIALACADSATLTLEVQDDGCGMDPESATRGLGLLGARERAAALGGELQVQAAPARGVRLFLRLPLQPLTAAVRDVERAEAQAA
jgi:glucose-6-phosphate-specific signal transduction histidine kinase